MKRIISVVMGIFLVLALVSCGKNGDPSLEGNTTGSDGSFVKPEQYASVLLVTINPQFRLYLDENGKVLAVEAVNEDAEAIKDAISFENETYETVIKNIVTEANNKGFVKEDATISLEIVESKETKESKEDILSKAEAEVKTVAAELNIEVKVSVTDITTENNTDPSDNTDTNTSNTADNQTAASSDPDNSQQNSNTTHTHSFSAATCTEPKKCSCGAVEGKALGHNYKDGVCTRCNAKDPNYNPYTSVLEKQGEWTLQFLNGKTLNSVSLTVCKPGNNSASVEYGDPLSTLPPEMQNDPNIKDSCEEFNGEYYYIGMGTGEEIKTVKEENGTVTLTDTSGNSLVLTRTGENTLKCVSAPSKFSCVSGITVGSVFTFIAS